jgi:hypothetical protein
MLLIEAKEIPIQIELVNMRSYGDKPRSFLQKVPNGMLPALEDNRTGNVALDSAYIMEFLEETHPSPGFKRMVPTPKDQLSDHKQYRYLMGLERELFRLWCTLVFRQEQPNPSSGDGGNPAAAIMGKLMGGINGAGMPGNRRLPAPVHKGAVFSGVCRPPHNDRFRLCLARRADACKLRVLEGNGSAESH